MKKSAIVLAIFIGLKCLLQYFSIHPVYELQRDEYLHLDVGKHLAWGYLSVPPMTGLISRAINLLGGSVFWVKFFPVLFGVLLMIVVWRAVEVLKGGLYACMLAATGVLFSAMLRINTLYQPNSLDYLCWTLLFYTVFRYIENKQVRWLYWSAVVFVIAFLNKYNIVFLVAGMVPALLLSAHRKIFLNKHLYFAALLALAAILPNIIWQASHGWPVVHHMKLLASSQLVNVNRADFLKEQILFFAGALVILLAGFAAFFIYPPFKRYQLFFWTLVFTLILFTYLRAKGYYAIGLYPFFLVFGAVYLEKLFSRGWLRYLRIPAVLLPMLFFIPIAKYILPILSPQEIIADREVFDKLNLTRWEDGKQHDIPQDFADMVGWKELAGLVDSAYRLAEGTGRTLVQCDNYGEAGAVNYYSKIREMNALSMNADYLYWYDLSRPIQNAVLVKEDDKHLKEAMAAFETNRYIGEVKNQFAREKGTKVYLLEGAKISVNDVLRKEIAAEEASIRKE